MPKRKASQITAPEILASSAAPILVPAYEQLTAATIKRRKPTHQDQANKTTVSRGVKRYNDLLTKNVPDIVKSKAGELKRPLTILDSGCGEAVAMQQLLDQDFTRKYISSIVGISMDYYSEIEDLLSEQPRFKYFHGLAQQVLLHESLKFDLIFDVWGVASYNPTILIELLNLYYNSLLPEGRAYIYLGSSKLANCSDEPPQLEIFNPSGVLVKGPICKVLPETFPSHFKSPADNCLVIRKVAAEFPLTGEFSYSHNGLGTTLSYRGDVVVPPSAQSFCPRSGVAPANVCIKQIPRATLAV